MQLLYLFSLVVLRAVAAQSCPELKLPWGLRYTETTNKNEDVCFYENVRFGAPPTGALRFQAPQFPSSSADPPAPANVSCVAMNRMTCVPEVSGIYSPPAIDPDLADDCTSPITQRKEQEDCLFLDIYVPKTAIFSSNPLPVIVWFYGGAFLFGSKTYADFTRFPLYDGEGIVSTGRAIFVAGNYRLGAYGWLAGTYMESSGQPNAGLLDQRLLLSFVNQNIGQLNGDPQKVSVWGESAGASSIIHHITMPQNIKEPLFRNAILQSAGYQWLWDRNGELNRTYTRFAKKAGCPDGNMQCLQGKSEDVIKRANQDLFRKFACTGINPVGPSVDGKIVPNLASYQIVSAEATSLQSILVSHVNLEVPYSVDVSDSSSFIPPPIRKNPQDESNFNDFLENFIPGDYYKAVRDDIVRQYPISKYSDQAARAQYLVMDSRFLCNTRYLIDRYTSQKTPTFALDYAFGAEYKAAIHASDLAPLFWHRGIDYTPLIRCGLPERLRWLAPGLNLGITTQIAPSMIRYFVNVAVNNDAGVDYFDNPWPEAGHGKWNDNSSDICITNVMQPHSFVSPWANLVTDQQTSSSVCGFWASIAKNVTAIANGQSEQFGGVGGNAYKLSHEDQLALNLEL